jgi:acyl-homoserine lactone synthase
MQLGRAMAELHVVRAENRRLYSEHLDEYFRARHEVYVGERGWTELAKPDGREIDQFDLPSTTYLLAIKNGQVVGGHRLVPTLGPTMMADVFPQLAMRPLVRSPAAYELSRIFVKREHRGESAPPSVESVVLAGTMEFALSEDIREFTIVMETWWLPRLQQIGWRTRPLGLPVNINGMNTIGVVISNSKEALEETRRVRSVPGKVLVRRGLDTDSPRLPHGGRVLIPRN